MARSRLKKPIKNEEIQHAQTVSSDALDSAKKERTSKFSSHQQSLKFKYLKHSPLLLVAILCAFWTKNILVTKYPTEIAHFILPNSYLALLLPVFLTITFVSTYLLLNMKRGIVLGIAGTLLLFFKLQNIQFEVWWLIIFTVCTVLGLILSKK